jgi:hypothetical protein
MFAAENSIPDLAHLALKALGGARIGAAGDVRLRALHVLLLEGRHSEQHLQHTRDVARAAQIAQPTEPRTELEL